MEYAMSPDRRSGQRKKNLFGKRGRKRAYLLCHLIHRHALGTSDMFLASIILPRAKDEHAAGGNAVKQAVRRFVIIAESIIHDVDGRI